MNTYQFPISTHMHIKIRDYAIITRINQNPNGFKNNHHINEHKYWFTIFPKWGYTFRKQEIQREEFRRDNPWRWPSPSSLCLLARNWSKDLSFPFAIYSKCGGWRVESGGGELPMEENLHGSLEASLSLGLGKEMKMEWRKVKNFVGLFWKKRQRSVFIVRVSLGTNLGLKRQVCPFQGHGEWLRRVVHSPWSVAMVFCEVWAEVEASGWGEWVQSPWLLAMNTGGIFSFAHQSLKHA